MKKSIGAKTIVFPTPVFIVGTYDQEDKPNVMTVAWGGICCSSPVCVCVSLREATYSYGNLVRRKAFTISIPSEEYIKQADYFGIASGRSEDKFFKTKFTAVKSDLVDAPYVKEFPFILECTLKETVKLGLHTLFIGEVKDIKVEESVLDEKGVPNITKVKPAVFDYASLAYFSIGKNLGKAFSIGKEIK
ncbi:MAG: flavin reductase family protein [Candidatus Omnitrophica bacterium]|nr:flavin reductase family protein [Candidatus Omnitrophota bacterium]